MDAIVAELEPIQHRHDELLADLAELQRILSIGADKARAISAPTLQSAKTAMGVTL